MSRDLTVQQALDEAQKRWGKNALVRRRPPLKPADIERIRKNIREDEEKRERGVLPHPERCEFVDAKGNRCRCKRGHDTRRSVELSRGDRASIAMVDGTPHEPRLSTEKRIANWEHEEIDKKLNGWCSVGRLELGLFFAVKAEAPTFREAFALVDAQEAKERAEYETRVARRRQQLEALKKARAAKAAKRDGRIL